VNVVPKPEYLHENQKFIDPAKLPTEFDGYPDFWIITVQKLQPVRNCNRDWAVLEDVAVFSDIREFLKFFGTAAREHEANQDKSMSCDEYMKDITVCSVCLNVSNSCECELQNDVVSHTELLFNWCINIIITFLMWLYTFQYVQTIVKRAIKQRIVRYLTIKLYVPLLSNQQQVTIMGSLNQMRFTPNQKNTLLMFSLIGFAFTGFLVTGFLNRDRKFTKTETPKVVEEVDIQGNVYGTTESQLEKEESQNVWYNPHIETTNFDVPIASRSLVGLNAHQLRDAFGRNCVHLNFTALDGTYSCRTGGVMIVGQHCLFNHHVLKEFTKFRVTLVNSDPSNGFSSNIVFDVSTADMSFVIEHDLCMMTIKSIPPYKDIRKFWLTNDVEISHICMLKRQQDANVRVIEVFGACVKKDFPIEALNISVKLLMGPASVPTQKGDCGSLAIAMCPRGPILCGIHTVGYNNTLGIPIVSLPIIETLIGSLTPAKFIVQAGARPMLGVDDEKVLVPIHHKSIFRYLKDGKANIFGAIPGFRPRPRSKVKPTILCDEVCEYFGTEIKHGKPAMSGWEPWHNNVKEMVKPVVNYDRQILKSCVASYTQDILTGLPAGWEKELLFLSDRATVNGLPGVKFIDRINTSTSMGFPWNTTKKSFLESAPDEIYPEGVDFTPEVWERVRKIEERYDAGECAYAIFTGHLKDEATPLKKCAIKKTRMFTGGPADWSLVVRKKLLTFVRLVQKNIFVFEAAPGVVVQSMQWTQIYEYLTEHGKDRIIAGDYGKFDKHMIADFILAAFEVICNIYSKAGFSDEEVRGIMCIGHDVAFPVVNVQGDLVQFFGTNPSGHPLTVIINSLVNSLYMRYAYAKLNGGSVATFKENVNLLTYGDDNSMGVSEFAPFFTHTNIQKVLGDIGVEYTMADKETESVPYINIDNCSFLKRTWRFDEDVGAYLAPLEEASIHRSLTMWVPSGSVDCYKQMVDVVVAANNEYFFYGRDTFGKHHKFFQSVLSTHPMDKYVTDTTLPSWDELKDRFWRASGVSSMTSTTD
jgi:hypothetical protein